VDVVERCDANELLHDLDRDAAVLPHGASADDGAQRPRDAAAAADHLADVVGRDVEQERQLALPLLRLDANGVRLVDQPPRELLQELSRCRSP
jgi:hypothetical protein